MNGFIKKVNHIVNELLYYKYIKIKSHSCYLVFTRDRRVISKVSID